MTDAPRPAQATGGPLCVVTRLEFPRFTTSVVAALRFFRLRRLGRRRIDGLLESWIRWSLPSTLLFVSVWQDESSLLAFTTLTEHVEAARWFVRAHGRVWSGVFELAGTSSMSEGWVGSIDRWVPRLFRDQERAP